MTRYLAAYAIALIIFLALDALWLGLVARGFYMSRIGGLILDNPRWGVAAVFYLLFIVGLVYFAISTGITTGNATTAGINGALFGFFAYLTYNATNLSTLKGWDQTLAVVDTAWGAFIGGAVSFATILVMNAFSLTGPK